MKDIIIIGSGGFGREVLMLIHQINEVRPQWNVIGFFDDGIASGTVVDGIPVLGNCNDINAINRSASAVAAIGNPITKKNILEGIKSKHIQYATLIHPTVIMGIDAATRVGVGSIITAGNILTTNITLGRHVIINLACTVGHDAGIGDYSAIMPGVNVSGEVSIGSCVFVGTGSKIINQIKIGDNTVIGAGSVVTKDIPANCTAVGVPAKPVKFHV